MAKESDTKIVISEDSGAKTRVVYAENQEHVINVMVGDLKSWKSSSLEEFAQFALAEFFAAGAFWLGVERWFTVDNWQQDILFWICGMAFATGMIVGFFGLKQMKRRRDRIQEYIDRAEFSAKEVND